MFREIKEATEQALIENCSVEFFESYLALVQNEIVQFIKEFIKIYCSIIDGFNENTFHEKCKNHQHTIAISWNNFEKIVGGYSPM